MADLLAWLENLPLATAIGESWWFPLLESIHVVGVALVVGALLMVDLRLLGWAGRSYPVSRLSSDLLRWTWIGFAIAIVTGLGLFITRASHYAANPAFQAKLLLLVLAGANMIVFQFGVSRRLQEWDAARSPPVAAKAAAIISLLAWAGVVLAGRWTGHLS